MEVFMDVLWQWLLLVARKNSTNLIFLCLPVRAEVVDKIIAVVNDEIITLYDLNAAFEPYQKNIENTYKGMIRMP